MRNRLDDEGEGGTCTGRSKLSLHTVRNEGKASHRQEQAGTDREYNENVYSILVMKTKDLRTKVTAKIPHVGQ